MTTTTTETETFTERHAGHICTALIAVAALIYGFVAASSYTVVFTQITQVVAR